MKKTLLILAILAAFWGNSQTPDRRWNVGIHGGATQYAGDLGSSFYKFDQAYYGHIGLSVSRYLTRHLDASLFLTQGELGYLKGGIIDAEARNNFLIRLSTANIFLRYNFFRPEALLRPYVGAGVSFIFQQGIGDSYVKRNMYDFALPTLAAGLNIRITSWMNVQLQETFMHTSADDVDFRISGINDLYLLHSVGLTFNLGALDRSNGEMTGVGERIDKCPEKLKQPRNKESKREARKAKKLKSNGNGSRKTA